ncbi:AI-2E family transporter [Granulicella sp. dw_53]|uniref:AI-2E family transporter n=1 Tax=Granulicella sp. dw_53 TaxID=2719792 RepID=UPI001BD3C60B|nr:AI-2E family transporter [Granulicella sp. dw_53]
MPESHAEESVWQRAALFLLTLGILVVGALVLYPFFSALVGAVVLAVVTQRPYDWLAIKIRNPSACALVALLLVILSVIIPSFFLAQDLTQQAFHLVSALRDDANQQKITNFIANHPALASRLQNFTDSIDINNAARATAAYLGTHMGRVLGSSFRVITQLVVMLFILFFLFRDRLLALRFLRSFLPLRDDESTELLSRLDDTIYATALGRLVIAGIQGILAGLGFWLLGVPAPFLWAFTTAVMAMIPAFGAVLVWAPIALFLGFNGHWGKAAILAVWGGVIVSTIDNILYPILVGTRLRAHPVTILISILGGISLFGVTGIILGPVTFSIAATLLDFWRARTNQPAHS